MKPNMMPLICVSLLVLSALCTAIPVMPTEADPSDFCQLVSQYGFANWPGKNGPVRDGFVLAAGGLPGGLMLSSASEPRADCSRSSGHVSVRCPSRPVITGLTRTKDRLEAVRFGMKTSFFIDAITSTPFEKLHHFSSTSLLAKSGGWPAEFPVVVSDSNLVGFPLSKSAVWSTSKEQINQEIDSFLQKYERAAASNQRHK